MGILEWPPNQALTTALPQDHTIKGDAGVKLNSLSLPQDLLLISKHGLNQLQASEKVEIWKHQDDGEGERFRGLEKLKI